MPSTIEQVRTLLRRAAAKLSDIDGPTDDACEAVGTAIARVDELRERVGTREPNYEEQVEDLTENAHSTAK